MDKNKFEQLRLEYQNVNESVADAMTAIDNIVFAPIEIKDITSLTQAKRIVQRINKEINTTLKQCGSNLKCNLKDDKYIFKDKGTEITFTFQILFLGNEYVESITDNIVLKSAFYKIINSIVEKYIKTPFKNEVYNAQSKPHIQYVFSVGNN